MGRGPVRRGVVAADKRSALLPLQCERPPGPVDTVAEPLHGGAGWCPGGAVEQGLFRAGGRVG